MSDREIWPSNTFKVFPSSLIKVQDCSFFVMLFLKKVHIWPTKKIKYSLKGTSNERFSCQCTYLICFSIKGVTGKLMTCLYLEYKKMIISYLHCISEVQQKKKRCSPSKWPKVWPMDYGSTGFCSIANSNSHPTSIPANPYPLTSFSNSGTNLRAGALYLQYAPNYLGPAGIKSRPFSIHLKKNKKRKKRITGLWH